MQSGHRSTPGGKAEGGSLKQDPPPIKSNKTFKEFTPPYKCFTTEWPPYP